MADFTIDVKNKPLGRVATEIAGLLQGKNSPNYEPRKVGGNRVVVKNIGDIKITGNKDVQKIYYRHSGKPGHLKKEKYEDLFDKTPEKVLINAVKGMLPRNKLRNERLKCLIIEQTNDR
ncbi:50S ribosomal protein L13 [Patescibacteria group bacterium]|nr:50S ribosomal protein L13 [Patescibacteria group bacterium]